MIKEGRREGRTRWRGGCCTNCTGCLGSVIEVEDRGSLVLVIPTSNLHNQNKTSECNSDWTDRDACGLADISQKRQLSNTLIATPTRSIFDQNGGRNGKDERKNWMFFWTRIVGPGVTPHHGATSPVPGSTPQITQNPKARSISDRCPMTELTHILSLVWY